MNCRRCGRPLRDKKSKERGYGQNCYIQMLKVKHNIPELVERILVLEQKVDLLSHPAIASNPLGNVPNIDLGNGDTKKERLENLGPARPHIAEIKTNPLFLKQKRLCN